MLLALAAGLFAILANADAELGQLLEARGIESGVAREG
jgi:hypothetical protein